MPAPSASAFLDEPTPPKASDYLDAPSQPVAAPMASDFLDQPGTQERAQQLAGDSDVDPAVHAATNPDEFEAAFQAQQLRDARSIPEKTGALLKTVATPSVWKGALEGAGQFGLGILGTAFHTANQYGEGLAARAASAVGATDAANTLGQWELRNKAESVLGAQKIEESLNSAGRGIVNSLPSFPTEADSDAEPVSPEAKAASDERNARQSFTAKVQAVKNEQQLSHGRPMDTGAVAAMTRLSESGQQPSETLSPEALESAGASPVRPWVVDAEAAGANPENLAFAAAPELPGATYLGGKLSQGVGKAAQIPGRGVDAAIAGAKAIANKLKEYPGANMLAHGAAAAAGFTHAIPAATAGVLAVGAKGLQLLGQGIEQQGAAAASGVPSALDAAAANARMAGQSAVGTNAQRMIGDAATRAASTAIGMAPLNAALSEGDPETFGRQEAGAAAFGGVADLLHSSRPALVEAARPALRQKGLDAMETNSREGRASAQFIQGLPDAQKNTALELMGAIGGMPVENAQGQLVPARMLVQSNADYQATMKRLGIGSTPQGGGQGFFWGPDGTAYINGEHSAFSDPTNAAQTMGHEFAGHAALNMLQAAGAKGGPIYDGIIRSAREGLYNPDGTPTPEFQKFVDSYNRAFDPTGQHQQIDTRNRNSADEFIAETAGRIISQRGAADIAVPQNILDRVTDGVGRFMSGLTGVDPRAVGTGGRFDRTEVAKLSQTVRDSLMQLSGLKLRPGEGEIGAIQRPQTPDEYVQELQDTLAKPRPTDTAENVKAWIKEQAQARKDLADFQGSGAGFPAAGRAPTPPSAPSAPANPARADAIKGMIAMGVKPAEAAQHVDAAAQALGANADASTLTAAALRVRQGLPPIGNPNTPAGVPQNIQTTAFNDPNGNRHTITGVSTDAAKPGDFVARQDGKVMRVVRVRPDGGLDTVFPATSNEQTTYPVDPGKYQVLTHETQAPNQPLSPGAGVADPGAVAPATPVAQTGDQTTAGVAVRPKVGPQIPPHPSGVPDIIDRILQEGGIVGKGKSPAAGTDQYADQPENSKRGVYAQLYGGTETPDQMAQALYDHHGIGDGSVNKMWQLIEQAIPERQNARQDIAKLVSDAETAATAAEKNPKTKAARDRIQAAKIKAITDAIGQDDTGLSATTDQFGQTTITGRFDPENPYHKALAEIGGGITKAATEKFDQFQNAQGKPVYIRYRSAKSDTAGEGGEGTAKGVGDMGVRQKEYAADPAQSRTEGQPQHKVVIPMGPEVKSPSGSLIGRFLTLDNLMHNAASIFEGMKKANIPNPYGDLPGDQEKQLVADAQAYAKNHANGYQGDGAGPIQQFPDSDLLKVNPDYVPTTIPKERFDVLNMMMHNETSGRLAQLTARVQADAAAGRQTPKSILASFHRAQESYALANENDRWIDHQSGETNQLRQQLKADGFDTSKSFKSPFETLLPKHILEVSDKPIALQPGDIPSVRPTGFDIDPIELAREGLPNQKAVAAGFLPSEQTPQERARERIETRERAAQHSVPFANASATPRAQEITMPRFLPNELHHGSPHDFDKFEADKIGTGEGNAAYGYGLYFAEHPEVAEQYRKTASGDDGKKYTVSVKPPPENFIDWDADFNDQPEPVKQAILSTQAGKDLIARFPIASGKEIYDELQIQGEFGRGAKAASDGLAKLGISGIRYLDQGSRAPSSLGQTRNYVVFDPKDIEITHKNGEPVTPQEKAQFLPDSEDPASGVSPGDRLAREAEQAGVVLKIQDYKDLASMKPETVARIRSRIEQNTGKPARFLPSTLYRASDDPEARTGAHFSENEEDAKAYQNNPGFGGSNLNSYSVDTDRTADVPNIRSLAAHLEPLLSEDQKEWAEEHGGLESAIKSMGFTTTFHALENSFGPRRDRIDPVDMLSKEHDWIRFDDDFPEGAKTMKYIGGEPLSPLKKPSEPLTPERFLVNIRNYGANRNAEGNSADYREAIAAHLGSGNAGGEGEAGVGKTANQQKQSLIQWAQDNGAALDKRPTPRSPEDAVGGTEHSVFFDAPSQRWIKTTKPGQFGVFPVAKNGEWTLSSATPDQYLQRLDGTERLFGLKTPVHAVVVAPQLVGFSNFSRGETKMQPSIVTSQPDIQGKTISEREIEKRLKDQGFLKIDDNSAAYYRPSDNTAILDAHSGNMTLSEGKLVGYDAIVMQPDGELKLLFERDHAEAAARQPAPKTGGSFLEAARARFNEETPESKAASFLPNDDPKYKEVADDLLESKSPVRAETPPEEDKKAIRDAYDALVKERGMPNVPIADVMERAGLELPTMALGKRWLTHLYNTGEVPQFSSGDWSLSDERKRAWGIVPPGQDHPMLLMKMSGAKFSPAQQNGSNQKQPDQRKFVPLASILAQQRQAQREASAAK